MLGNYVVTDSQDRSALDQGNARHFSQVVATRKRRDAFKGYVDKKEKITEIGHRVWSDFGEEMFSKLDITSAGQHTLCHYIQRSCKGRFSHHQQPSLLSQNGLFHGNDNCLGAKDSFFCAHTHRILGSYLEPNCMYVGWARGFASQLFKPPVYKYFTISYLN
uniref:Uncharacterized protein n=1 Tax=Cucumis melo TaxID=3656 RepID=A0A9I9E959_CUCME